MTDRAETETRPPIRARQHVGRSAAGGEAMRYLLLVLGAALLLADAAVLLSIVLALVFAP
jgi:hypothetical protein